MDDTKNLLLSIPEATLIFWIIKVLLATIGKTGTDFLSSGLGFENAIGGFNHGEITA